MSLDPSGYGLYDTAMPLVGGRTIETEGRSIIDGFIQRTAGESDIKDESIILHLVMVIDVLKVLSNLDPLVSYEAAEVDV